MGRIVAPFGVKGWIRIEPWTAAAKNLLAYPKWWIGDGNDWQERAFRIEGGAGGSGGSM